MTHPNFDPLAPHYRWLEAITFGPLLQWCRTAMLPHVRDCRRALVLGDGNGRFLAELLAASPAVTVDALDISPAMTELACRRMENSTRVQFQVTDVLRTELPPSVYDLLVTNFFLDCFDQTTLEELIPRLASTLVSGGRWIVGDFRLPERGWARIAGRAALTAMYAFFRIVTRLPAGQLVDPEPLLCGSGLELQHEETRLRGFLSARLWRKPS